MSDYATMRVESWSDGVRVIHADKLRADKAMELAREVWANSQLRGPRVDQVYVRNERTGAVRDEIHPLEMEAGGHIMRTTIRTLLPFLGGILLLGAVGFQIAVDCGVLDERRLSPDAERPSAAELRFRPLRVAAVTDYRWRNDDTLGLAVRANLNRASTADGRMAPVLLRVSLGGYLLNGWDIWDIMLCEGTAESPSKALFSSPTWHLCDQEFSHRVLFNDYHDELSAEQPYHLEIRLHKNEYYDTPAYRQSCRRWLTDQGGVLGILIVRIPFRRDPGDEILGLGQ